MRWRLSLDARRWQNRVHQPGMWCWKKPRAHGITLAGDGIGTRSGFADVAGDEGEIDHGLCGADSFVRLVDAHGPPPGNAFAGIRNEFCQSFCLRDANAGQYFVFFW